MVVVGLVVEVAAVVVEGTSVVVEVPVVVPVVVVGLVPVVVVGSVPVVVVGLVVLVPVVVVGLVVVVPGVWVEVVVPGVWVEVLVVVIGVPVVVVLVPVEVVVVEVVVVISVCSQQATSLHSGSRTFSITWAIKPAGQDLPGYSHFHIAHPSLSTPRSILAPHFSHFGAAKSTHSRVGQPHLLSFSTIFWHALHSKATGSLQG